MPYGPPSSETAGTALEAYLLGQIDFQRCLALQQRLVHEVASRQDGRICLLVCEHPNVITVGRSGSAGDVPIDATLLRTGQLAVHWVKRGGGCLVHAPGQLAIYPIVPLQWHGLTVGRYLTVLQEAIQKTLAQLNISVEARPPHFGLWGRTGQLVAFGVAVENWVAYHGAFVNVSPSMGLLRLLDGRRKLEDRLSCLVAERRGPTRMTTIRAELIRQLSEALGCDRYHLYTGHPLLK